MQALSKILPFLDPIEVHEEVVRIFISSPFQDLAAERTIAKRAIDDLNRPLRELGVAVTCIDLQHGASPEPPFGHCMSEVGGAQLYIGLLGTQHGTLLPDGRSMTEAEFDQAGTKAIDRLFYYRKLANHEVDSAPVAQLKKKVDVQVTRHTFDTAAELRTRLILDIMTWALKRALRSDLKRSTANSAKSLELYLDAASRAEYGKAATIVLSQVFRQDIQRFGRQVIYRAILQDLLELTGPFSFPRKVTDPKTRGRLLLEYASAFSDELTVGIVFSELERIRKQMRDLEFSFRVFGERARRCIHVGAFRDAKSLLCKMSWVAWRTLDRHIIIQSLRPWGMYYSAKGKHRKALKVIWTGIGRLNKMKHVCPFCMSTAFIDAGVELSELRQCMLACDRLAKGFLIARRIRNRDRESLALLGLAEHYERHGKLRDAVATYVVMCRVLRESDPSVPDSDERSVLDRLGQRHGASTIRALRSDLGSQAEEVFDQSIADLQLQKFCDTLGITYSNSGDHW